MSPARYKPIVKRSTVDKRCGQERGYYAHRRRGEKPCPICCDAHNQRNTARYATAFGAYRQVAS